MQKAIYASLIFIALFAAVVFFLSSDSIAIKTISVEGTPSEEGLLIQSLIKNEIGKPRFGLLPQNNFLFIDQAELSSAVRNAFPEIGEVKTRFNTIGNLVIGVKTRPAAALWCAKSIKTDCMYIDDAGQAFKPALDAASSTLLRYRMEAVPELKSEVTTKENLEIYNKFLKAFSAYGLKVGTVIDYGSDVFLKLEDGTEVRARLNDNPEAVVSRFSTVYQSVHGSSTATTSVEYVDVRFGNKVFLKRKTQ
jgi:cell division septal protein FtsQ